jgi:uncharacterized protein YggE
MRYFICVSILSSVAVLAQAQPAPGQPPSVRAQGTATATAKPDQLRIDIGVVTQASTAQQAGADNARQFTAVVDELRKAVKDKGDVQTVNYNISPNYRYPKEGGTPTITGYTATNIVRVTSSDVDSAGKIIDAASKVGANAVRGIEFSLKNEQALRAGALAEATRDARANAAAMATGVGMKIVRVLRIEDSGAAVVRPNRVMEMAQMRAMVADSAPTPVEPGNIRVDVTVFLTGELGN